MRILLQFIALVIITPYGNEQAWPQNRFPSEPDWEVPLEKLSIESPSDREGLQNVAWACKDNRIYQARTLFGEEITKSERRLRSYLGSLNPFEKFRDELHEVVSTFTPEQAYLWLDNAKRERALSPTSNEIAAIWSLELHLCLNHSKSTICTFYADEYLHYKPPETVTPSVSCQLAEAYSLSKQTHPTAQRFLSQCNNQRLISNIEARLESETDTLPRAYSLFEWALSQSSLEVERFRRLILALSPTSRTRILQELQTRTKQDFSECDLLRNNKLIQNLPFLSFLLEHPRLSSLVFHKLVNQKELFRKVIRSHSEVEENFLPHFVQSPEIINRLGSDLSASTKERISKIQHLIAQFPIPREDDPKETLATRTNTPSAASEERGDFKVPTNLFELTRLLESPAWSCRGGFQTTRGVAKRALEEDPHLKMEWDNERKGFVRQLMIAAGRGLSRWMKGKVTSQEVLLYLDSLQSQIPLTEESKSLFQNLILNLSPKRWKEYLHLAYSNPTTENIAQWDRQVLIRDFFLLAHSDLALDRELYLQLVPQLSREVSRGALGDAFVTDLHCLEMANLNGAFSEKDLNVAQQLGPLSISFAIGMLKSPLPETRRLGVGLIGQMGKQGHLAVRLLAELLNDPDEYLRRDVSFILSRMGSKAALELIPLLKNSNRAARLSATTTIGNIGAAARAAGPILLDLLLDEDSEVRVAAIFAMGQLGIADKPALLLILDALQDRDYRVRYYASWALGTFGEIATNAVPSLLALIEDENLSVRLQTLETLGKIGPAAQIATPRIIEIIREESATPQLREKAVEALKGIGKASVPAVIELLHDDGISTRDLAIFALGEMGVQAQEALPHLEKMLKDATPPTRMKLIIALGGMGPPSLPLLIELLKDEDPEGRYHAALALLKLGDKGCDTIPHLLPLLLSNDVNQRGSASVTMSKIGFEAVPSLLPLLKAEEPETRALAAWTLGRIGKRADAAIPSLIELLLEQDDRVVKEAIKALGQMGERARAAIPALLKIAADRESEHRKIAISALGSMGEAAVPGLIGLLRQNNRNVQTETLAALSEIGAAAEPAVPFVLPLLSDENDLIRIRAAAVLGAIGEKAQSTLGTLNRLTYDRNFLVRAAGITAVDKIAYSKD